MNEQTQRRPKRASNGVGAPAVKSADRAVALIELLAEHGPLGFSEILEALALPRSSAHGLLQTLTEAGWVAHSALDRQYSLGLRAWQVGQKYTGNTSLVGLATPIMERLRDALDETVQMAQLDGVHNIYIAISETAQPMRLVSRVGGRLEAHATGIGKALLSMLPEDEAEHRLREAAPLAKLTNRTVTDIDGILKTLNDIRRHGFAIDDEEYISGCRCVAVPLAIDPVTSLPTAISVTMPTSRTSARWPMSIARAARDAAAQIRQTIGVD